MKIEWMKTAIFWCGLGHFALSIGSLYIPKALEWRKHLSSTQPLIKQMFWTYAAYILGINFFFGMISVLAPGELLNGSLLSKSITLFIACYWLSRVAIQFFYFDKSQAPKGLLFTIGEILLVGLFLLFGVAYLAAFLMK